VLAEHLVHLIRGDLARQCDVLLHQEALLSSRLSSE